MRGFIETAGARLSWPSVMEVFRLLGGLWGCKSGILDWGGRGGRGGGGG